jgi:uncharacterized membrane protein
VKPVTVSVTVEKPRQDVYEFLEVLANHEAFTDHLFTDWKFSGPRRGVGAQARARVNAPSSREWTEFEIVEAEPDQRIVEEGVGAGGKRRTRGTYLLEDLPEGKTRISFELAWQEVPRIERLAPPLNRAFVRRANGRSMRRLAKQLAKG